MTPLIRILNLHSKSFSHLRLGGLKVRARKMRKVAITLGLIASLLIGGYLIGFVGIHYPKVIENQRLLNPQTVVTIEGDRIELQDGRVFEMIDDYAGDDWPISETAIHQQIDLEPDFGDEGFILCGNRDGWICGTPWAKPIVIPIIGDPVYRNRREPVALAREITP